MLFSLLCLMTSLSHADILCDGADDLILTGAPTGNLVTFGTGTLTVWVTVNGATKNAPEYWNGYGILGDDGANIGMWRGLWAGNGTDMLYGAGADLPALGTTYTTGTWYHLALTWGSGTATMYINGTAVGSGSGWTWSLNGAFQMCNSWTGGGPSINGTIAGVRTYPTRLSTAEIATLGKSRLIDPLVSASPSAFWPMDDCPDGSPRDGLSLADRSINHTTATATAQTNGGGVLCQGSRWLSYGGGAY